MRAKALLVEHRYDEDVEDEETEEEIDAASLVRVVGRDLPEGITIAQEGERAVLRDREGFERTVTSLARAWQIISEYGERRSLRT